MPSLAAAAGETSMIRCFTNGPRSVTVTFTDLPVFRLTTLAFVPSGSVGLAAVKACGRAGRPLAVVRPADFELK